MKHKITKLAAKARSHIAQIAASRFVLKALQTKGTIDKLMEITIQTPDKARFFGRYLDEHNQKTFKKFNEYYKSYPPEYSVGHTYNMSAVLLVDGVLQKYLKELYILVKSVLGWDDKLPNSLSALIRKIFIGNSSNNTKPLLDYSGLYTKYKHVLFLDQLRHVIIHNQGEVDDDFYKKCGIDPVTGTPTSIDPALWGLPSDWVDPFFKDNIEEFKDYFVLGSQVGLPINKVLGLFTECFVFIDDVEELFKERI